MVQRLECQASPSVLRVSHVDVHTPGTMFHKKNKHISISQKSLKCSAKKIRFKSTDGSHDHNDLTSGTQTDLKLFKNMD